MLLRSPKYITGSMCVQTNVKFCKIYTLSLKYDNTIRKSTSKLVRMVQNVENDKNRDDSLLFSRAQLRTLSQQFSPNLRQLTHTLVVVHRLFYCAVYFPAKK